MKGIFALLATVVLLEAQVPYERILKAHSEPGNWLTYGGDYQEHGYSALDQINTANVGGLKVSWMYQIGTTHHFETSPLVFDGIMYLTEPPSDVTALDLRTGRPIWTYRRSLPKGVIVCCGQVNRGLAVLDDQLFLGTVDAHLVALDLRTGRVRWDVEVADYKAAYSITVAPLAVKDKIIVGIAGAEYGIRGSWTLMTQRPAGGRGASGQFPRPASPAMKAGRATVGKPAALRRGSLPLMTRTLTLFIGEQATLRRI